MCDPSSLAKADIFSTVAGGVSDTLNVFKQSSGRKRAAKFNEAQARQQADDAMKRGEDELRISGIRTGRLYGAQRAAFAGNGIDMAGSPTALNILADTSQEGIREGQAIRDRASNEAQAYRTEAEFHRYSRKAENPFGDAAVTGLGVGTRVAAKWYKYKKVGLF